MDTADILKQAWESVKASGVPESLYDTALREAVAIIRDGDGGTGPARQAPPANGAGRSEKPTRRSSSARKPAPKSDSNATESIDVPDDETFFGNLADEAGVDAARLRDIIRLQPNGAVIVTPATRNLGSSKAEQARTVVSLVAPARLYGLGENPISGDAVRTECTRKNCFDTNNFGAKVVGSLGGVNYGGSNAEIVLTARWIDEFKAAVAVANGDSPDTGD
jgi:hypothetical protein